MYIPDKLKLNRYKTVRIPTNRDYFEKYGKCDLSRCSFTGDDDYPLPSRKLDEISRTCREELERLTSDE